MTYYEALFEGKVVFVFDSASGIGAGAADAFSALGAETYAVGLSAGSYDGPARLRARLDASALVA